METTHHTIGTPPPGTRAIRIVQLSDLHLQAITGRERAAASEVERLAPDPIVISGDAIDRADALPVLDRFLSLLGPTPKVAVLGNWEHWSQVDLLALRALYERTHGVRLLVNGRAEFRFGTCRLHILGLDAHTAGRPDRTLLENVDPTASTILVQHSPGWFRSPEATAPGPRVTLCLSGHTHGGQVALLGRAPWTPRGSGDFTGGRYDLPLCALYVSRGIGTSILPVRFGARPEIAVFAL